MTSRMPDAADLVEPTLDGIDNGREAMGIVKRMRQEYRYSLMEIFENYFCNGSNISISFCLSDPDLLQRYEAAALLSMALTS